ASFVTKGFHRIETAGAPGGDVAGGAGDKCQSDSLERECCRVARRKAKELALHDAREHQGKDHAGDDADSNKYKHFTHHQPDDIALSGAERHADADFAGTLRDSVGHDAIESDDGQQRGKETEDSGEAGDHALGGERVVDLHFRGSHGIDGNVGVKIADFGAQGGDELIGIADSASVDDHAADVTAAEIRLVDLGLDVVAQAGVLDVLDDADDFHVGRRAGIGTEADMKTDGIAAGKIFFRKGLIDHDDRGLPAVIGGLLG